MNKDQLVFAALGFELVGVALGSIWIGPIIDGYFGIQSATLILMFAGCIGVFWKMIFLLNRLPKK